MSRRKLLILGSVLLNILFVALVAAVIYFLATQTAIFQFGNSTSTSTTSASASNTTSIPSTLPARVTVSLSVADKFKTGYFTTDRKLTLPEGLKISVLTTGLKGPRGMDFDENGNLYVAEQGADQVVRVTDYDTDGIADDSIVIATNVSQPNSVDYYKGDLYIAATKQIIVLKGMKEDGTFAERKVLVDNLGNSGHTTKTIVIGPDEKMYVASGSTCNVCEESDPARAAITRYNLDGTGGEIFAKGLRNTVGMTFYMDPVTLQYKLYGVDNGRDLLGDDLPAEEVNVIEYGNHYGWPFCHGKQNTNPEYPARTEFCTNEAAPSFIDMQAHSAPLGIVFIPNNVVAPLRALQGKAIVGFHGSWNRTKKTGYKVVWVDPAKPEQKETDLITGWLEDNGTVWGRPVDVKFGTQGELVISDDQTGAVYVVR